MDREGDCFQYFIALIEPASLAPELPLNGTKEQLI